MSRNPGEQPKRKVVVVKCNFCELGWAGPCRMESLEKHMRRLHLKGSSPVKGRQGIGSTPGGRSMRPKVNVVMSGKQSRVGRVVSSTDEAHPQSGQVAAASHTPSSPPPRSPSPKRRMLTASPPHPFMRKYRKYVTPALDSVDPDLVLDGPPLYSAQLQDPPTTSVQPPCREPKTSKTPPQKQPHSLPHPPNEIVTPRFEFKTKSEAGSISEEETTVSSGEDSGAGPVSARLASTSGRTKKRRCSQDGGVSSNKKKPTRGRTVAPAPAKPNKRKGPRSTREAATPKFRTLLKSGLKYPSLLTESADLMLSKRPLYRSNIGKVLVDDCILFLEENGVKIPSPYTRDNIVEMVFNLVAKVDGPDAVAMRIRTTAKGELPVPLVERPRCASAPPPKEKFILVDLNESHPDYQYVAKKVHTTTYKGRFIFIITKIQRVWNPTTYDRFGGALVTIREDNGGHSNVHELFHGTDKALQICERGYDERLASKDSCFGVGVYFAAHSSKSNRYSFGASMGCPSHNLENCLECPRTMLFNRVALGRMSPFATLQMGQSHAPENCHSGRVLTREEGGILRHTEYVIFRGEQALPEYLITYRLGLAN